jgi:hypothetical protein
MYGLALEVLDKRMAYDPATGAAIPYNSNFMKPGAATAPVRVLGDGTVAFGAPEAA